MERDNPQPIFEADLEGNAYGYRPRRSAIRALFLNRRRQPHLDEVEDVSINGPAGD
jgi:hypothetical protein